jgi:hypothetical protein
MHRIRLVKLATTVGGIATLLYTIGAPNYIGS